eukprot:m.113301 g.113301  ORF g.113301 m.113301 type:complete len:92 (-) comp15355_c0_seq16:88-363(-)
MIFTFFSLHFPSFFDVNAVASCAVPPHSYSFGFCFIRLHSGTITLALLLFVCFLSSPATSTCVLSSNASRKAPSKLSSPLFIPLFHASVRA